MTYSEVQFYLAEAAQRIAGINAAKDAIAEGYYKEGVKASFDFWNVSGSDDYLATVPYDGKNSLALQSYFASYTRGDVSYTTYRRLDLPMMNEAPEANTSDGSVPSRFTYPINEQTLNAVNYQAASKAIGGDKMETKLFWDIH